MEKESESPFNTTPPCCLDLTAEQAAEEMKKIKETPDKIEPEEDK